jgi:NhaP-type Na+/H+ or K+/H+ antiporter
MGHVARVVIEAIGLGALIGLALTWSATGMLRFAGAVGLDQRTLGRNPDRCAGGGVLRSGSSVGGSGFIACFVGGLLLSGLGGRHKAELLRGAEHMGEALALFTSVVFGGIVVARMIDRVTWPALFYAVLSLTVVRMLPVFLCLIGTRSSTADKLFIGWFGPRGLSAIVFAILVLDEKLPGNDTIVLAAGWTVLLSIVAHGVTANPLVRAIGRLGCVRLLPGEEEADVAGHSSRILDHLCLQAKTERPQVIMPEFVAELGSALQGLLPVGQRVVDPSTAIGA